MLPYLVQLGLVAAAGLGLLAVPETVSERSALSLRFRGLGVPEIGRAEFIAPRRGDSVTRLGRDWAAPGRGIRPGGHCAA